MKSWRKMTWAIVVTSVALALPAIWALLNGLIGGAIMLLLLAFPIWLVVFAVESVLWFMTKPRVQA
jgi:hypothetical protein